MPERAAGGRAEPVLTGLGLAHRRRSGWRRTVERSGAQAEHDRPLPRPHCLDRVEGKGTPLWEQAASADDDLVGVVGVSLVADVVEPAQVSAVARYHPVAGGGGEQTTELGQ